MPGTRSKGKLWWREWIFSLRNWMFLSIKRQCCDAATKSKFGSSGEAYDQVTDQVELLIPSDHNNLKAT